MTSRATSDDDDDVDKYVIGADECSEELSAVSV
jgi:hypothetical protein